MIVLPHWFFECTPAMFMFAVAIELSIDTKREREEREMSTAQLLHDLLPEDIKDWINIHTHPHTHLHSTCLWLHANQPENFDKAMQFLQLNYSVSQAQLICI